MLIWHASISDPLFEDLLTKLDFYISKKDLESINKFVYIEDRKRAIVSILLQEAAIQREFPWTKKKYCILRTREVLTLTYLKRFLENGNKYDS